MANINANRQNSSGSERVENVPSLPNHTSSSFYYIDPFNSNINYDESLSSDTRQAITSQPFFGQSGGLAYGTLFPPYLCHQSLAEIYSRG